MSRSGSALQPQDRRSYQVRPASSKTDQGSTLPFQDTTNGSRPKLGQTPVRSSTLTRTVARAGIPYFNTGTKVFPDPRLAKAVVDRITHKAHIIDTGTESWRFRHGLDRKKGHKA